MELIWAVACFQGIQDKETNSVSLINVLEQINFNLGDNEINSSEPIGLPTPAQLVTMWWRSDINQPENGKGRLILLSPSNEKLVEFDYDVDLSNSRRFRYFARFMGLPFKGSGIYRFITQSFDNSSNQWIDLATTPFELIRDFPELNADT